MSFLRRIAPHTKNYAVVMVIMLALISLSGCGGTGNLSGKVTFNKQTVTSGTVQVIAEDGSSHTSPIGMDGSYSINNIPTGKLLIGVDSPNPKKHYETLLVMAKTEEQKKTIEAPSPEIIKTWIGLPDNLATPNDSNLTFDLQAGNNSYNLELTGQSPVPNYNTGPAKPPRAGVKPR